MPEVPPVLMTILSFSATIQCFLAIYKVRKMIRSSIVAHMQGGLIFLSLAWLLFGTLYLYFASSPITPETRAQLIRPTLLYVLIVFNIWLLNIITRGKNL